MLLLAAVGVGGAYAVTQRQTKVYGSSITFFLSDAAGKPVNPLIAESAQTRFSSYALLAKSPPLLTRVRARAPQVLLSVDAQGVAKTIFMKLDVRSTTPGGAYALAQAFGAVLPPYISSFEGSQSQAGGTSLAILSPPTLDGTLLSPHKTRNLGAGLLGGLLLGLVLAGILEALDTRLRKTDELVDDTQLALLASIPRELRKEVQIMRAKPRSKRAEAVRQIRANLQFCELEEAFRVLVVTSAVSGEGKTSVATELALACAEAGQRVILVDADLRRPRVGTTFGLSSKPGLTDVLHGSAQVQDALHAVGSLSLQVLTSGGKSDHPSEDLASDAMGALLTTLADASDLVIVDSAPLLPVADTSGLLAHADAAALVVKMGVTTRAQAQTAAARLRSFNARVLGVVANAAKADGTYGGYGYGEGKEKGRKHIGRPGDTIASSSIPVVPTVPPAEPPQPTADSVLPPLPK